MQLEVPNLMEQELVKQMEGDLRRVLAGTDIRADGSAITAGSLDESIKNLFAGGFYEEPRSNGAFEPTITGANSTASVKQAGGGSGSGGAPATATKGQDINLPAGLQKLTGAKTVGEFLGQGVQAVAGGALMAINPLAGLAFKGVVSAAEGATVGDTVAEVATSLNPFSSMAVKALGAIGAYDRAEGLLTSASDAYQTVNNLDHVPSTLAGRNVINAQVESAMKATGHYDSNRNEQKRASQAAMNRDNVPSYAQPNYGNKLTQAANPAKVTPTKPNDSSKNGSYQQAGGIGKTDSSAGHAPAGGVGPSPSKGSSSNGNGKNASGSSGSGSSKGGSSSSSGGSKGSSSGNGKSGSGSYGGR